MTKEELYNFITTELYGCRGYEFIDRTISELDSLISKRQLFNCDKFCNFLKEKHLKERNNPLTLLTKFIFEDIKRGLFDVDYELTTEKIVISAELLFTAMRNANITVDVSDTAYIERVETYIVVHKLMTISQLVNWNRKAVKYLANKNKTSKDFIFLFKNTREMRQITIPFEQIEKETNEFIEERNKLIAQVDYEDESETNNDNKECKNQ